MKRPAFLLAVGLLLAALFLVGYRILKLGYPILPAAAGKAWGVSVEARVPPNQANANIRIAIPYSHEGQLVVEERITSSPLSFTLVQEGLNHIGIWSGSTGPEGALIRYDATVLLEPRRTVKASSPPKLGAYPEGVTTAEQASAQNLTQKWMRLAPRDRLRAIAADIASTPAVAKPDGVDLSTVQLLEKNHGRLNAILTMLRAADLPARVATGFFLAESVMAAPIRWVEVWTGEQLERMEPETAHIYPGSASFVVLTLGAAFTAAVSAPETLDARWDVRRQIISQWRIYFERIRRSDRLLDRWSLFSLPPQFQETFRILLLVPIGALMICVLRNVIGFPTFGIFMPVLMALAFRSTGLAYGLCIFGGVLLIGYVVRRALNRLRLLLVPRLSVMVTLVIGCFTVFALIGGKVHLRELMAVGLLPFVILTMVIERFFVTVEESGAWEAFKMAFGSAVVATITYEIIHIEGLQLTFFVYPELLLAVAAVQVLLGRYTGYRLSEYLRFRSLRGSP